MLQYQIYIETQNSLRDFYNNEWELEQRYIDEVYENHRRHDIEKGNLEIFKHYLPMVRDMSPLQRLEYIPGYMNYYIDELQKNKKPRAMEFYIALELCRWKWLYYGITFKPVNTKPQYI